MLITSCRVSWVCHEAPLCPTPWYTCISFGRKLGLTAMDNQSARTALTPPELTISRFRSSQRNNSILILAKWILFLNTNALHNVYCIRMIAISQSYWNRLSLVEKQWTKFSLLILWSINPNQGKMTYWKGDFTGFVAPSVNFSKESLKIIKWVITCI